MKTTFTKSLFIGLIALQSLIVTAQNKQYTINKDKSTVSLIIDSKKMNLTVDNAMRRQMGQPLLEARLYPLNINADTIGIWSETAKSKKNIWKVTIDVPEAKGFFVELDEFYLPQGSQLFVYNKNNYKESVVFTSKDNPKGGPYSLENLHGDNVVLEYVANKNITEKPRIHLADVGYKYGEGTEGTISGFRGSHSCMVNINCTEGTNWQAQKKGVVHLRIQRKNGYDSDLCTGTLINNTNNDRKPYILTAYHCLENADTSNPNAVRVFFDYEAPDCETPPVGEAPSYKYHRGAHVRVLNPIKSGSDGALLELTETIPHDWNVYFNGWDRSNSNNITGGAVIHHPKGDIKKISLYNTPPVSDKWDGTSPDKSFWAITYSLAATQGGSSGCPMFNQDGLVVGTLTGGNNMGCDSSIPDYYGKLWYHWDQSSDANAHMDKYLDPSGEGKITSLAGLHNNEFLDHELVVENSTVALLLDESASINIISGNGDYIVDSVNTDIINVQIKAQTITIKALQTGDTEFKVKDKKNKEKNIKVSIRKNIDIRLNKSANKIDIGVYESSNSAESDKIDQIRVIDLNGHVLYSKKNIEEESFSIDMLGFNKGLYAIQVKTKKGTSKAEKIIW